MTKSERERLVQMLTDGLISQEEFETILRSQQSGSESDSALAAPTADPSGNGLSNRGRWLLLAAALLLVGGLATGFALVQPWSNDQDHSTSDAPSSAHATDGETPEAEPDDDAFDEQVEADIEYLTELGEALRLAMIDFRQDVREVKRSTSIDASHRALETTDRYRRTRDPAVCDEIALNWLEFSADRDQLEAAVEPYREALRLIKRDIDATLTANVPLDSTEADELAEVLSDSYADALIEINEAVPVPENFQTQVAPSARVDCDLVLEF